MAWDSAYTSQLNGGYQGMAMNQMAYSQQIGMGGLSGMPGLAGQQIAGGIMNRAQGIGMPLMQGLMGGYGGINPMEMGMGAAFNAWKGGSSLLGAGLSGMGAAGATMGVMGAAGWAGNQMFAGAQQQMQLNGALRGSFNFTNPMTGGQGFSSGQMGQIGSMMRGMTHETGPGGETTGMSELTSLAANMGRMGMGNQVRDVQEFGRKFREMVGTLKTIATEMGTSLQEAQQFMNASKNSGMFRTADQLKFATQAKGMAFAGGLSMSEVTSMGNIGSQISRSVGGLGRQGAFGGMNTIGQIGVAQQMGVLSEEDIYNTTGLSGAEGRQAFATGAMQQTASFLKGGKGRRMLASLAGANGQLNEEAVQEFMSGGMSTGETMRNSRQNLSGIGRANFLRNEGRLRGAVMERLGGFAPAMQLRQWLEGRGMDVNVDNDRSMLFAQRQLGMGRDEAEQVMKMAQDMPQILKKMQSAGSDQKYMDQVGRDRQLNGLEGIKNRMSQAREKVQGTIQEIGRTFFQEMSSEVESALMHLSGTAEERFSKDAWSAYKASGYGGSTARGDFQSLTSTKGLESFRGGASSMFGGGSTSFFGNQSVAKAANWLGRSLGARGLEHLINGGSQYEQYRSAGYNFDKELSISDPQKQQNAVQSRLQQIQEIARAANQPVDAKLLALGAQNADWLKDAYANGRISGGGDKRMASFESELYKHGNQRMIGQWQTSDSAGRARMMSNARAGAMGGQDKDAIMKEARAEAAQFAGPGGAGASIFAGAGTEEERVRKLTGFMSGGGQKEEDLAAVRDLRSEASSRQISGLLSTDAKTRDDTRRKIQSEMAGLQDVAHRDTTQEGRLTSLRSQLAFADVAGAGGEKAKQKDLEAIAKKYGLSMAELKTTVEGVGSSEFQKREATEAGVRKRAMAEGGEAMARLTSVGVATFSGGKVSIDKDLEKSLGKTASAALSHLYGVSAAEGSGDLEGADASSRAGMRDLEGMSVADKRKAAKTLREKGDFATASIFADHAQREEILGRDSGRKGVGGAIAGGLGIGLSKEEAAAVRNMKDPKKIAAALMGAGHIDDPKVRDDLEKAITSAQGHKFGAASDMLQNVAGSPGFQALREKEKEKRANQQRENDPVSAAIEKQTHQTVELLKLIAKNKPASAEDIAAAVSGDTEGKGGGGGKK